MRLFIYFCERKRKYDIVVVENEFKKQYKYQT